MSDIVRPTLLLNEAICKSNIRRIAEKASKANVTFRPHFKTHQSHEIGRWYRPHGVTACTVSSVKMAAYFAEDGWNDITIAFPMNTREIGEINRLGLTGKLNLLAVDAEGVALLSKKLTSPVGIFIEIDPGYNRTGLKSTNYSGIDNILAAIAENSLMEFKGFLSHAGQSYRASSHSEIMRIHDETTALVKVLGDHYHEEFPDLILSVGDTPTCSVADHFLGIDEIRPGNLVFYDLQQSVIGSCKKDQVAIAMACPVVAMNLERNEVFVHGGGVHFAKDFLMSLEGTVSFGEVVLLNDAGWELNSTSMYMKSLSQEHGVIQATPAEMRKIKIGDCIGVLPVHACLTADAMGEYSTLDGRIISMMK
ncbi:alanine racemase [soil metagenome]